MGRVARIGLPGAENGGAEADAGCGIMGAPPEKPHKLSALAAQDWPCAAAPPIATAAFLWQNSLQSSFRHKSDHHARFRRAPHDDG